MNLSKGTSCCASGHRLGSQHFRFGWADRDDSFYGKNFDVSYSTFLISFVNLTLNNSWWISWATYLFTKYVYTPVFNMIRFPDRDPTGFCNSEPDPGRTGIRKNSTGSDMDIQTALITAKNA